MFELSIQKYLDSTSCVFESDLYEDGEEWSPDSCTTCKCLLGNTVCDTEECPKIICKTQKYVPLGKCCPICAEEVSRLNKKFLIT